MKTQLEISWDAPEPFALAIKHTLDGERIAKEKAQSEADKAESEKKQTTFTKNIMVVADPNSHMIRLKHIEFKPEKHEVVMGRLRERKTGKDLGQINRVYSE